MRTRWLLAAGVSIATVSFLPAHQAGAFGEDVHIEVTRSGLDTPGPASTFLRSAVLADIYDEHAQLDKDFTQISGADDVHFDDCEFAGGASRIRSKYSDATARLGQLNLWLATDDFGEVLHSVQDFYSHSNWVELGFPRSDDPATNEIEAAQSDLVDLSGARSSLAQRWFVPASGAVVRDDILLGNNDLVLPAGWTVVVTDPQRQPYVPTVFNEAGAAVGRLLMTGEGFWDDECDVYRRPGPGDGPLPVFAFDGFEHNNALNKDDAGTAGHEQARKLAALQTSYEWCRLVREAGAVDRDGLLLSTWIRDGGNPHPPDSPCAAPARQGPVPVVVTVEQVTVLDSNDDSGDEPGEIQVAVALYDDPSSFRRSVHATSEVLLADDGDVFGASRLPGPLTLCVPRDSYVSFALHGWDNDDDTGDALTDDFDDQGDNPDDLLVGFKRRFSSNFSGEFHAGSDELEVRFRVSRGTGNAPVSPCPPEDAGVLE